MAEIKNESKCRFTYICNEKCTQKHFGACHSASYSMDTWSFFPGGVKWPEREADHSLPSSTEVKNTWRYASNSPYACSAWCL